MILLLKKKFEWSKEALNYFEIYIILKPNYVL